MEENANPTRPNQRIPVRGAAESEVELNTIRQVAETLGYELVNVLVVAIQAHLSLSFTMCPALLK